MKDKYSQLEEDLISGDLNLRHLELAYRFSIRQSPYIPTEAKDILAGSSEVSPGLIHKQFEQISAIVGSMELVVRRAKDK